MADLSATFSLFATKAEKKEATTKDVTRWCTDAGVMGKNCNSNHLDISFSKVKTKGKPTITCSQMDALCTELAKMYTKDKKMSDEGAAKAEIISKLSAAKPKAHGTTGTSKTGGVGRMTDTSKYTGAHKERFDESGKGKGKEGRADTVENSGYVGNYKGENTYDKK
ncbi:hypothetical protein CAPTEDRAFT_21466 [Capitella teleta]|uniref:Tubulin polymerization-promoting protein family member 3 n=1 Tax=Capitella teleta TaxID=283909 RepID=R7TZT6_CAPTE|nr:hypothetical protein CAPTEDRAFT_21466 [Capitella teleta]|eukprot:ELT96906.1 hypothetical protein CAPTEDRAFT_21466 [Capitella teleta]